MVLLHILPHIKRTNDYHQSDHDFVLSRLSARLLRRYGNLFFHSNFYFYSIILNLCTMQYF